MRLILFILLFSASMQSQDTWILGADGKRYIVNAQSEKEMDKWDIMLSEWEQTQTNDINTKAFNPIEKVKDFIEFVKKHRFTSQEKNIYNHGVDKINESAGGEVLERIE